MGRVRARLEPRVAIAFLALVACETLAQTSAKLTADAVQPIRPEADLLLRIATQPWAWTAAAALLGAFVIYMGLLAKVDVGPLFTASHLELATTGIVGAVALGERMSATQLIGCGAILAGVAMLAGETRTGAANAER